MKVIKNNDSYQIVLDLKQREQLCFAILGTRQCNRLSTILPVELRIDMSQPDYYVYDVLDKNTFLLKCIKYGINFSSE